MPHFAITPHGLTAPHGALTGTYLCADVARKDDKRRGQSEGGRQSGEQPGGISRGAGFKPRGRDHG
jgi:hypothetical protein